LKPNILFVLIDACRADRLYGNRKTAKTPNIDFLINNGIYFSNAISSSDYTGPVVQSIFTARFPFGCGTKKENYHKIYSKATSYLTILKENGYHAYATMEKALCDQGWDEPYENNDIGFEATTNVYNGLGEKIIKKLDPNKMVEPWFYYVHFMDLHIPCIVPKELSHLKMSERYDQNIFAIDSWIGKMLERLNLGKTLIVLVADHGEYVTPFDTFMRGTQKNSNVLTKTVKTSLKSLIPESLLPLIHTKKKRMIAKIRAAKMKKPHEKRMLKTRPMVDRMFFDDIVHVPLLFCGYGIKHKSPISRQVGSVDIFPTIFELLNITAKNENVNGRSLVPIIEGKKIEYKPIYMESGVIKTSIKDPKPVVGIRTQDYKYFRSLDNPGKNVNLYDLRKDPFEDNNLANNNPDKIKQMEKILEEIRKDVNLQPELGMLNEEEEKELEAELKKLGYV